MNPEPNVHRDAQIRRTLVATVDLTPLTRRRPPVRLVVGAIAAFALAGALTGGAVANASDVDPAITVAQNSVQVDAALHAHEQDLTIVGHPFTRAASGAQTINLGPRPKGATDILESFQCIDPDSFTGFLDHKKYEALPNCKPGPTSGRSISPSGSGDHILTIQAPQGARFAIWLSWVKTPHFTASAAEKAELADGVITRAELVAAYNRYQGCMGALGYPMNFPTTDIAIAYTLSESAVDDGADLRCQSTEFQDVDSTWQVSAEETDVATPSVNACLMLHQVVPASTPVARYAQLQDQRLGLSDCAWVQG